MRSAFCTYACIVHAFVVMSLKALCMSQHVIAPKCFGRPWPCLAPVLAFSPRQLSACWCILLVSCHGLHNFVHVCSCLCPVLSFSPGCWARCKHPCAGPSPIIKHCILFSLYGIIDHLGCEAAILVLCLPIVLDRGRGLHSCGAARTHTARAKRAQKQRIDECCSPVQQCILDFPALDALRSAVLDLQSAAAQANVEVHPPQSFPVSCPWQPVSAPWPSSPARSPV